MKDKLIARWDLLNRERFWIQPEEHYPLFMKMERLRLILLYRYGYLASYSSPSNR